MIREIKNILRKGRDKLRFFYLSLGTSKECPICGWIGHAFIKYSSPFKLAPGFRCPACGSSERHRFAYLALREVLTYSEKTLHFAPEKCIESWLRSISKEYLSVDLSAPIAMLHMDITDLQLEDGQFQLIWCSHVLEHVENDSKAISELYRVLRADGLAVIMVPVYGDTTYEDYTKKSPEERLRHFKQKDHVRLYGRDILGRLEEVGFHVRMVSTSNLSLSSHQTNRYVVEYPTTKEIFLCSKEK